MKAVPAKVLALGLACLLCAGVLLAFGGQPRRAAAESLQLTTVTEVGEAGTIDLLVKWHWEPPATDWGWKEGEQLLAVSFDIRSLVFVAEEAPFGVGADGGTLHRLEAVAGPDGARRLFVIPEGRDGFVRLRFLPKTPGAQAAASPFRIHVVYSPPAAGIWTAEATVPGSEW